MKILILMCVTVLSAVSPAQANQRTRSALNAALESLRQAEDSIYQAKQSVQDALYALDAGVTCIYVTRNSPHYEYTGSGANENDARLSLRQDCVAKKGADPDDIICRDIARAAKSPNCPRYPPRANPPGELCCYNQ